MPFTPYHMGPGLLIKAGLGRHFSLVVFGWSQILTDLQPLAVILTGKGHVHGFSHTFLGATLIALLSVPSGKYLGDFGICVLQLDNFVPIRWMPALLGAFIGTYSHVLLDGLMHPDLSPFAPFSAERPWLGRIGIPEIHLLCVLSGLVGLVLYWARYARTSNRGTSHESKS